MDYINSLSKFGTKLEDRNQRVKFPKLKTRYRVIFEGFAAPIGGEDVSMDMKTFQTPKGKFEDKQIDTVNGPIYYPGLWTWDPVSFTVYDSHDNASQQFFIRQIHNFCGDFFQLISLIQCLFVFHFNHIRILCHIYPPTLYNHIIRQTIAQLYQFIFCF